MAQQLFSKSQDPVAWQMILVLEFLQQTWVNTASTLRFAELHDAIHSGLENMNKWYQKTDDTDAYFICLGQCSQ